MNTEEQIQSTVRRLDAIAKTNNDEFSHAITILKSGTQYLYECNEKADGHCFVSAIGPTINQAVAVAETQIADALAEWGYQEPSKG